MRHRGVTDAISALWRSLELTPDGHADLPSVLDSLVGVLSSRFSHSGHDDPGDISEANAVYRMLVPGYRRVVATMWAIKDKHAPDVASDFYQYLWGRRDDNKGSGFDGTLSACALHYATQKLRQRLGVSEQSLLAWTPYVHYGY